MTISEVSKQYDISTTTLRYYERIGLIHDEPRDKGGKRDYDENACQWVELIKWFRSAGVQIEALVEYVELNQQGDETWDQRRALLVHQRELLQERIAEMRQSLEKLNHKIAYYDRGPENKGDCRC